MKTTVDLPEELWRRAKSTARAQRVSLRQLLRRGLERELEGFRPEPCSPIRALRRLSSKVWRDTTADRYVLELRRDWA